MGEKRVRELVRENTIENCEFTTTREDTPLERDIKMLGKAVEELNERVARLERVFKSKLDDEDSLAKTLVRTAREHAQSLEERERMVVDLAKQVKSQLDKLEDDGR